MKNSCFKTTEIKYYFTQKQMREIFRKAGIEVPNNTYFTFYASGHNPDGVAGCGIVATSKIEEKIKSGIARNE